MLTLYLTVSHVLPYNNSWINDPWTSVRELLRVFRKYLSFPAKMAGRLQIRGNRNIENHTHLKKIAYEVKSKHEIVFFFSRFLVETNSWDYGCSRWTSRHLFHYNFDSVIRGNLFHVDRQHPSRNAIEKQILWCEERTIVGWIEVGKYSKMESFDEY